MPGAAIRPLAMIFSATYLRRTIVNTALVSIAIIGLWAGTVYEPTALITLAHKAGLSVLDGTRMASLGTAILSVGTILGCLLAADIGRTHRAQDNPGALFLRHGGHHRSGLWLGLLSAGRLAAVPHHSVSFWALPAAILPCSACGCRSNITTEIRATAFAFCTSFGRFLGAGANFAIAGLIAVVGLAGLVLSL